MALQDAVIPIDFGQGVDTKSDPKQVVASKFRVIENGIFTNAKRITKRNGYDSISKNLVGGGTWSSPTMVKSYLNELVLAATTSNGQRLLSYSESLDAWKDKGKYLSIGVSKNDVGAAPVGATTSLGPANSTCAVLGNIALFCYESTYSSNGAGYYTVVDLETGTKLAADSVISTSVGWQRAALLGTNQLAIFYITNTTSNTLAMRTVTVTQGSGVVLGAEVTIAECLADSNLSPAYKYCYDYVTTPTGASLVIPQVSLTQVKVYNIDTSGAVTASSATSDSSTIILPVSISKDSSNNLWVYWAGDAGTYSIYYKVYSSSLSPVLSKTTIATNVVPQQLCAVSISATQQKVFWSEYNYFAGYVGVIYSTISQSTITIAGSAGSPTAFLYGCDILSKPIFFNGTYYLCCVSLSSTSPTGFLVDVADSTAVSKFIQGKCEGLYRNTVSDSSGTNQTATIIAIRRPTALNDFYEISSTKLLLCSSYILTVNTLAHTSTTNTAVSQQETVGATLGMTWIGLEFDDIDAYQSLIQQDTLVLNGGLVYQYDSASVSELGFSTDPDNVTAVTSTSTGSITTGNLAFYVTYSWTDELGNIHQSAPSNPIIVHFTTGSSNKVVIYVSNLILTQKTNVQVNLYGTLDNGQIAYLANSIANSNNAYTTFTVTSAPSDTPSAAVTYAPFELYTQGDAILPNIAPPPSLILWTNINRLWCVDSQNPETTIEYSKTASAGTGISFSTGLGLDLIIDSKGGAISGASPMDEKTVILKKSGVGFFYGDGNNDSGVGSTISQFLFVPSDTGCTNSKSVILYPNGILYRTNKGIYQLSRGVQTSYFGFEVESYNSQDIVSAVTVPNRNQIRFLTSSGSSLLFDYVFNQWSVFTNHAGLGASVFQDKYVYVRSDGDVYLENATTYLDNTSSYSLSLQSAWLHLGAIQGFQRVRWMLMLGDYQNGSASGHGLSISSAYDFGSFGNPVTYTFGQASSSGVFQYRNFFSQQKCDTISILISEVTTGQSGEYIDLTNMSFMAGMKRGTNKLAPQKSVG